MWLEHQWVTSQDTIPLLSLRMPSLIKGEEVGVGGIWPWFIVQECFVQNFKSIKINFPSIEVFRCMRIFTEPCPTSLAHPYQSDASASMVKWKDPWDFITGTLMSAYKLHLNFIKYQKPQISRSIYHLIFQHYFTHILNTEQIHQIQNYKYRISVQSEMHLMLYSRNRQWEQRETNWSIIDNPMRTQENN